jgi:putative transposase
MSQHVDPEDRRTEIALFRYTLILPLLRGEYEPRGKDRLRQQIAAGHYDIPYSTRHTVSVPTLARWERRYRKNGFDGLKPRRRGDRGTPRAISPQTLDRAEALKREQPLRSSRSIVQMLRMDTTQPIAEESLAPRTLRRQLARRNATTAQLLGKQRPKPYRRFERPHFGDLWQGDAMHGPKLPDPANPGQERQVFLFAFLDDYSRLIPHAQFYWNEQLPRMEDCFKRAILRYGRPLAVYVDQGKVYTSKQFDTICATLGIQRILGTPYYPEGRGKACPERSEGSSASSSSSSPISYLSSSSPQCPIWHSSTSPSWPGSRSFTTARCTAKQDKLPSNATDKMTLPRPGPQTRPNCVRPSSIVSSVR